MRLTRVNQSHRCPAAPQVVPQRDGHVLELNWQVPASKPLYRYEPLSYLSHLLGHEGDGSVFALLKAKGWATSLVAGEGGNSIDSRSFFYVKMDLTEEGHQNAREVAATVFRWVGGWENSCAQGLRDGSAECTSKFFMQQASAFSRRTPCYAASNKLEFRQVTSHQKRSQGGGKLGRRMAF